MFTFLPDEYKKIALKEYRFRLFSVWLGLVLVVCTLGAVVSIPSYSISHARTKNANTEHNALTHALKKNPITIEKEVTLVHEKLNLITTMADKHTLMSILERILSEKGNGTTITSLNIKRKEAGTVISISGIAESRDLLVAFSKRLQEEPSFLNVQLPVASLAKSKNVPFNMSFDSSF